MPTWVFGLLSVLAVLLAFVGVLGPENGLFYRDHSLFFRPEWWSIHVQLRELSLPVLNLAHPGGQPHEFSTNYALFTPLTLVLLLGPFEHTYDLFVVSHFAVLAMGVFLLARELGARGWVALAAAGMASLSGPIVSFENLLVGLSGFAFSPWVWWALVRVLRRPSPRNTGLLALTTAMTMQGIMPETLLLHAVAAVWALLHSRPKLSARLLIALGSAGVLAALVGSVDWVPQLDALAGSRRWAGFDASEATGWSFGPFQLAEILVPAFWASPNLYFFNVPVATGSAVDPPYLPTLYLGIALPLALAAPFASDRRARVAGLLALFFVVLAAGSATPLHGAMSSLPLLRSSRFAIKYLVLAVPAATVLACLCLGGLEKRWRALLVTSAMHTSVLFGLFTWTTSSGARAWLEGAARPFQGTTPFEAYGGDVVSMALEEMASSAGHAFACAAFLLALILLGAARPHLRGVLVRVVVVLLLVDLSLAVRFGVPIAPTSATRMDREAAQLFTQASERATVMVRAPRPVPHVEDQTPFADHLVNHGRHGLLAWDLFRPFDSQDLEGLNRNPVQAALPGWLEGLSTPEIETLLSRANVRFVLGPPSTVGRPVLRFSDHVGRPLVVSENPARREPGLASLHSSWMALSLTSTSARSRFVSPFHRALPVLWTDSQRSASGDGCEQALTRRPTYARERIRLRTRAACPTLLVLREVWYPRWRASVDQRPVEPVLVEAGFIGLQLPAGEHEVEIVYDSLTRRWLWVSGLSALLCCFLVLWGGRRLRTGPPKAHQTAGVHSKN